MTFSEVVTQFVEMQKEDKSGRTYETYRRKIEVFQEFLEREFKVDEPNFKYVLEVLKQEDFIRSVRFYVEHYDIHYKATTDSYFAILGVFFKFLWDVHKISNECFTNTISNQKLKGKYENLVNDELKLNDKELVMPPSRAQVTELIQLCDQTIDNATTEAVLSGRNNGAYAKYISALITKFTLFLGWKNQVIDNLPVDAYDPVLHKVAINGYWVHIPDRLALQMQRYLAEVRPKLVELHPNDRLFVGFRANACVDNAQKYSILEPVLHHTQGTAVAKYAIMQMIREQVPSSLIMEFTGWSNTVYRHCNELVEDESSTTRRADKSRLLDQAFRGMNLFDML